MKKKIEEIFHELNVFSEFQIIEKQNKIGVAGQLTIGGKPVTLHIFFDEEFPLHKPEFIIQPANLFGMLPHVSKEGHICYIRDEGIIIDQSNIGLIIEQSLQKVIRTLEEGISGINNQDLMDEFEVYWNRNVNTREIVESLVSVDEKVREIALIKFDSYNNAFLGDSKEQVIHFCEKYLGHNIIQKQNAISNRGLLISSTLTNALYIPLESSKNMMPPSYDEMWDFNYLYKLITSNISEANKLCLENIIHKPFQSPEIWLVSFPITKEKKAVIGLKVYNKAYSNKIHPLASTENDFKIEPSSVIRLDQDYIVPRGGGQSIFSEKRVAIIGCGSVGSTIAIELIKAGILNLTLVDNDSISIENIFRHSLGVRDLKFQNDKQHINDPISKVDALKWDIENRFPYASISIYDEKIEKIINKNLLFFKEFDLIIVAIGNPTIELHLNQYFHNHADMPPVIFTWLEAYGVGGHALLTKPGHNGCYNCLFEIEEVVDEEGSFNILHNKTSFAAAGQSFAKQLSGCYSLFTPFGSLDAIQTAIVAVRLACSELNGVEDNSPLLSWKGDATPFLSAGKKLSKRYELNAEELLNRRCAYKKERCPVCTKMNS